MLLVESNLQKQSTWWKWYKDCPKKVIVQIVLKIKIKKIKNKKEEEGGRGGVGGEDLHEKS